MKVQRILEFTGCLCMHRQQRLPSTYGLAKSDVQIDSGGRVARRSLSAYREAV